MYNNEKKFDASQGMDVPARAQRLLAGRGRPERRIHDMDPSRRIGAVGAVAVQSDSACHDGENASTPEDSELD